MGYFTFSESIKEQTWNDLFNAGARPKFLTDHRMKKIKTGIWNNEDFWFDLLLRHGLMETSFKELEADVKNHALGNFWGMLACYYKIGRV
jgi:hypothetical protein